MFGVMGIINLAHGSLAILAAFGLFVLAEYLGVSPFLGLIAILPGMAVLGWLLQRTVLERSARGGILVPILATFGLAIVIDNLLFEQFGADTRSLAPYIGSFSYDSWSITDDIYISQLAVLIFATAVAVLGGLQLFLSRTQLGRAIRATAIDPDTVGSLSELNARLVNATATAIALVTVGLAGAFLPMRATFSPYSGAPQLIFAFEAAVIGGAGSLWGTTLRRYRARSCAKHRRANQSSRLLDRRPCGLPIDLVCKAQQSLAILDQQRSDALVRRSA